MGLMQKQWKIPGVSGDKIDWKSYLLLDHKNNNEFN